MKQKNNKLHIPQIGDILEDISLKFENKRGIITNINKKDNYIQVQFEDLSIKIPYFINKVEILGIEKRNQIVWKPINKL